LPHEGAFGGVATTTLLNYKAVTIEMEMTAKKKFSSCVSLWRQKA